MGFKYIFYKVSIMHNEINIIKITENIILYIDNPEKREYDIEKSQKM